MKRIGNVLILGDSYSTFEGCIPEGYETWYDKSPKDCNDLCRVEDCWWHRFFSEVPDVALLMNHSYSGTTVCHTGYNGEDCRHKSFIARLDKLIAEGFFEKNRVDTMIIYGGTNDSWAGSPKGEPKHGEWTEEDLFKVFPAVSYLISRAVEAVPEGRVVFILNYFLADEMGAQIAEACRIFGAELIRLSEFQLGGGHPTVFGMEEIYRQVREYFEKGCKE